MSGYEAYPEYRDSGVEWLGDIPTTWNVMRIKHLSRNIATGRTPKNQEAFSDDGVVSWFTPGDFAASVLDTSKKYLANDSKILTDVEIYKENSILVIGIGATLGRVALCEKSFSCNQQINVITPIDTVESRFLKYALSVQESQMKQISNASTIGIMNQEKTGELQLAVVDSREQQNIANFLDHETAKIDTLIEKQQQLIKLLKEKRQAVISHAVTKGLNPDAPMKDSGVEWLGEVPAGWRVCSLGYCSSITTGATPDRQMVSYWGGDIPWIKTGEVNYSDICSAEETVTELAVNATSIKLAEPGTLLMAMYGQGVTRGRVALLGISATYNQACAAIVPDSNLTSVYLKYYFMSSYNALRDGGNETSQMNLNAEIVGKFPVLIPTPDEQDDIVRFLESSETTNSSLLGRANEAIDLLKERRTALISAAVTGKIDVRNWQAPKSTSTPGMDR